MGNRSRLFASAAFPLLSLSLMLQPASAALYQQGSVSTVNAGRVGDAGSIEVAQQAAPDPAQVEQELLKKKKAEEGQAQPEQKPEKHAPAAEPQAPKPPKQEAPKVEAPKAEAPKQEAPKAEAPKQEAPKPAPAAEPQAAPKPKAAVEAPAAQPEVAPKPKAAAAPQAVPAEPAPEAKPKKHEKAAEQAPAAAPAPAPEAAPKPKAAAAEQPVAPAAEPAAPAQPEGQPKKHHKPQDQTAEPTAPAAVVPAAPAAPAQPADKPAQKQPAEQQAAPATDKPAPKAEGAKEPAKQQQGEQPAAAPAAEKPAAPKTQAEGQPATPGEKPAPAKQPDAAQAPGKAPVPAAPVNVANPPGTAPANGAAPAANAAQQATPAPAGGETVSPQELERRKKIAENPAANPGAGPVILPVQNGTAVLDSDKDAARRGHHQGNGQGQPTQAGQPAAASTGQAAQRVPAGQAAPQPAAAANVRAPTSDADAQRASGGVQAPAVKIEAVTSERGQRMDQRPNFAAPDGARIENSQDNRLIINFGDEVFVRHDDTQRFTRDGERPSYEQLDRDRYRETIDRPDGDRIVTVRNRYGDIIQRSRIDARGREYVLFYSPELENQPNQDDYYRDPGDDLPPMRLRIPVNQYIIDTSEDENRDYYDFLRQPPVEPVERIYSLNEVRYSARIRDKVRRIDLDTITFATGSADIPMVQAKTMRGIAEAMGNIIKKDPTETFLIEGHTDAVGTPQSNLVLSDKRAESVANVLTDVYGIPPENLATQGYGEQYLKVQTDGPEQQNRRVTIRRVTALVRPVASRN